MVRHKGKRVNRVGTSGAKQGSKRDRERLRHELLGRGRETAEVAEEMSVRWGFNRRQAWRFAHGLSQEEAAVRYNRVLDDRTVMTGKRVSDYEGWPLRGARPTLHVLTVFAQVYGTSPRDLLSDDELSLMPRADQLILDRLATVEPTSDARSGPGSNVVPDELAVCGPLTPASVRAAARASSEHAAQVETTEVGPITLNQLEHDIFELARAYIGVPAADIFPDLTRHRDRVYGLLGRHVHPAQARELYLLAGQACGLLASASMELGCLAAATAQARAAWTYAEIIDHNGLRAWVRGTQALIAFWSGDPRETVRLAESGRDHVSSGTGFVRLCNIESRGWAYLGNRTETVRVITMGHRARDRAASRDELHDVIGGEFGFDDARQAFCNAGAYVQLGQPNLVLQAAERAIRLYPSDAERNRTYGGEGSTRLEMAQAHLMNRALDAAEDVVTPVLDGANNVGGGHLPLRLSEIQGTLVRPPYRHCREALELAERIQEFCTRRARGGPEQAPSPVP